MCGVSIPQVSSPESGTSRAIHRPEAPSCGGFVVRASEGQGGWSAQGAEPDGRGLNSTSYPISTIR